ncbi:MAG: methionyl-tRNA formyltransferase [Actinomycetota bacterium]|nr:methionyl-tRNA formyltransferase [Actinomycetota bacterium]
MARLVFLGTPDDAVSPLDALVDAGHEIVLVVTRADARRGRRGLPSPSPVKARALERGLPVTDRLDDVFGVDADLGVVVAYGRIIPEAVLRRLPMVNLHFSLLPRWRGAAPVERAILAGDRTTGVCVMAVEPGLDTGAVYAVAEVPIGERDTSAQLRAELSKVGSDLLVSCLEGGVAGLPEPSPQVGEATYAHKLDQGDFAIDWSGGPEVIDRLVRLGRAWTTFRGRRLHVLEGHPADGASVVEEAAAGGLDPGSVLDGPEVVTGGGGRFVLDRVQVEGRQAVDAGAWWRGARAQPGELLGTSDLGAAPEPGSQGRGAAPGAETGQSEAAR